MASGEEPGINHVGSPSAAEMESNDGERGNVSASEGCYPQSAPDLRPSSPSFVPERSFSFATPSGEVQFQNNSRFAHTCIGEPAQGPRVNFMPNPTLLGGNDESNNLRAQIAAMQASLSVILTQLENQNVTPELSNTSYGTPPIRSTSVPSSLQSRTQIIRGSSDESDRYTGMDRSISPHRYGANNFPNFSSTSPAPVNTNHRYRSNEPSIKVAVYDGKSSWKDYLVQFELAAQENGWNQHTRAIGLACSLRGSAQALLSDLTPEIRQNYDRLVTTLTERFEPQNQCELYKAQLKQRIRKRDEGLPELAQDIKRLTRMAYPSAFIDLRDTLSKDSFIEALNEAEMELFISQKEPATIDDAVRLALKYEAFTQGRRKRLSSNKAVIRMQYEEDTHSTISRNEIEEIKNDIRELRTGSNGQPNRGKPNPTQLRACYGCGQTDHMVRSCPFKATPDTHRRYGNNNYHQNRYGSRNGFHNNRTDRRTNNQSAESYSL